MVYRIPNGWLSFCIVVVGLFVTSACSESIFHKEQTASQEVLLPVGNDESDLIEYIIVLNDNVDIARALNKLKKYEVQVIRDLNRGRYLIGLKNDPGIEQLRKDVEASEKIKLIQPNFTYTIQ